jgi:diguanylate cyclase (GGDEF)-like protein
LDIPTDHPPKVAQEVLSSKYTLSKAIHSTSAITLTHQQNLVTFEFSALHFSNPKKNRYAYKMEGLDNEWVTTDYKNRRATYTNLPHGNYILRVKASTPQGVWNEKGIALKITVLPPPWLTWWAYVLYCIIIFLIIGLFIRAQQKKVIFIQKVNERLEGKVIERTIGLQKANDALEAISVTDDLTGLKNRRFISNNLKSDIDLVLRKYRNQCEHIIKESDNESDLIFFLIDLDHFKQVNDIYGHTAGDSVLRQIKSILALVFRETDYLVRWGGEEFLVIARFTDRRKASTLAERLRKSVEMHDFIIGEGMIVKKTCSIGYASFPFLTSSPESLDWERVLDIADHCLYAAKESTRNAWIGLDDLSCSDENLFHNITEETEKLINLKQLKVECSLLNPSEIKWN